MEQGLLPKNFFKNEPLEEMSTAIIAHFSMTALFADYLSLSVNRFSHFFNSFSFISIQRYHFTYVRNISSNSSLYACSHCGYVI